MLSHLAHVHYCHAESLTVKWKFQDYAIETPMKKSLSSAEGDILHEVKIDLKPNNDISAINFVLKVYISYS